jgi:hypothetical protein
MHPMLCTLSVPAGIVAVALTLLGPTAAAGQEAGTYSGTLANGYPISVTVGPAAKKGESQVTQVVVEYKSDSCTPGKSQWSGYVGFAPDAVISSSTKKATLAFSGLDFYFSGYAKFSGASVTGAAVSYVPVFASSKGAPTSSVFCAAKMQKFSATLGTSSAIDTTHGAKYVAY